MRKTLLLVAIIAALTSGCRYSKEYQKLTEAGNKYTTAVDKLLLAAGELHLDSSSERILEDDIIANQTVEQYQNISKQDREMIRTINNIRLHNQLLRRYFNKLDQIAKSDAPSEAQEEIEAIADNINSVSLRIQKSQFFTPPIQGIVGNITNLAIHSRIKGVIRKELEKRNQIILRELTLQREMLKEIGSFMKHRTQEMKQVRENRLIIRPLIASNPIRSADIWINERRKIFFMDQQIQELTDASQALDEFKDIFQASVEGKINSQRLNNSLKDIDSFLSILENSKKSIIIQES
ncbi:hypothetical protein [Mastigocoleus testarum]|uniref:Uncharacterized protein n=1 Tax=Mastigocoleus testarum BC008 TaxID=371196 RepID=A0A0V7ZDD9_9CYAN|nr:hypothetical protein [Mastigocoleus testarum]KST62549.1 hypothetical protein BC008_10285 [Mastigocoleus testarum BC008]KST62587.1 hypothetical protein BC008_10480 [Mastigocoleus testarum BC008]